MARCEHPDRRVFRQNGLYSVRCPRCYAEFGLEPDPDSAWRFFEMHRASRKMENESGLGGAAPPGSTRLLRQPGLVLEGRM